MNILFYNAKENQTKESTIDVQFYFNFTLLQNTTYAIYQLDNINTNSYLIWKKLGRPVYPSLKQFSLMKSFEAPLMRGPYFLKQGVTLKLKLLNPGVTSINICKAHTFLQKVRNLRFIQTWNLTVQFSWSDTFNRCVFTYIVEHSTLKKGPYQQLNKGNVILPYYWHSCYESDDSCFIEGFYRVKAVDYWNNDGPYSNAIYVTGLDILY